MIVNKKQLSEILGVSERTLTDWQDQRMPVEYRGGRGSSNQYDTARVIEWMIQRALAGEKQETARERRDRLEADMLELKLAREAGLLVSTTEIEPIWQNAILAARTELMGWAYRLKGEIDDAHGVQVNLQFLVDAVDQALTKLAERPPEDDNPAAARAEPVEGEAD